MDLKVKYILAAVIAAPLLLAGCDELKPAGHDARRGVVSDVTVAEATVKAVPVFYEATGTVKAVTVSRVSARVTGTVTAVEADAGDLVEKGQLLLTIDDSAAAERLRAARAGLEEAKRALEAAAGQSELAEKTYERFRSLHEQKAVSAQEFDEISTMRSTAEIERRRMEEAVKRAEASVGEARAYRSYTEVRSPVTGVVTARHIDAGTMAAPGMPLFTVDDTSSYVLELQADERHSGLFEPGTGVKVRIDSLGRTLEGTVTDVTPSINPATRTFLVKVSLDGPGLRTGLFARTLLPLEEKELLLVPAESIVRRGALTGVYVVGPDRTVTYRLVRTGTEYDGDVEVLTGLAAGERIIVEGVERAFDGGRVADGSR